MSNGLPHVTDILKRAGLVDDRWFTEEARDVGTGLHLAAHFLDEGDLAWKSVDRKILPRLRQYQCFLDEVKPTILAIEEAVTNEALRYCGKLDRRVRINGREWIIDLKGPGRFPWQPIQLAGYAGCFPGMAVLRRGTLHLSDDRYQLIEHSDRRDWDVYKAAVTLAAWKEKNGE